MNYRTTAIYKNRRTILRALKQHQIIIIESPTGSGKSTCLPLILHEKGVTKKGIIGVTQPRRIATLSLGEFIAKQIKTTIPGLVGYKMRFEDCTNQQTRIKIMTDGTLLQEMKADHSLSAYKVIIIDEAHERSLTIDFILGILKRIAAVRSDLKIIISSATINPEFFAKYFNDAPIISIKTKSYPVEIQYQQHAKRAIMAEQAVGHIIKKRMQDNEEGDILVFLQGEQNIKKCFMQLQRSSFSKHLVIYPLYGRLSKEEQETAVYDTVPPDKTKVILATNIAETSLTIDNIRVIIDSGLFKIHRYNTVNRTFALNEIPISQSSATQRAGRAGRQQAGTCYRLYTEKDLTSRKQFTTPEIIRTDLSEVVLRMAEIGIKDFEQFDFISQPNKKDIHAAVEILKNLDALDKKRNLTEIGNKMLEFPLIPRHGRILLEAMMHYPNVLSEILIVISFLTSQSPYLIPIGEEAEARRAHRIFSDQRGDFYSVINIFNSFTETSNPARFCTNYYFDSRILNDIVNARQQLEDICIEFGSHIGKGGSTKDLHSALARGLFDFICIRHRGIQYCTTAVQNVFIHPGSVLFGKNPEVFLAGEIVYTTKMYARSNGVLDAAWLPEISPELHKLFTSLQKRTDSKKAPQGKLHADRKKEGTSKIKKEAANKSRRNRRNDKKSS